MNSFYADYKNGLLDISFRQAILGNPPDQQNRVCISTCISFCSVTIDYTENVLDHPT